MGLIARLKTWVTLEDLTAANLNAEFDNILDNLIPTMVGDYSANAAQMQSTTDPGEVGTESLATTLAGEIQRIRFVLAEITGRDEWYESPVASLLGLSNAVGTGLTDNRIVSGRTLSTSVQPAFLVPNGASRIVKLDGTPTNFVYYIDGVEYSITTDVTLTSLTAAPSSNNTCLINDVSAADQYWTFTMGEDGSQIPVDGMGSEITGLIGKFAAFKLNNGSSNEYFIAFVKSATALAKVRRGYFFDSTDTPIPRISYADNDTITLMKLTWVFAKTDGTLTATYNNPIWADDEPTSPAIGDYWFDTSENTWKTYQVGAYIAANAVLVGTCIQDTSATVGARSFDAFANYSNLDSIELYPESNSQLKARQAGSQISVYGNLFKYEFGVPTWDMTLDLASGVTEAASTYYYFYVTETGDVRISNVKPYDRREDLQGFYHPSQSWRCVGYAYNNASSNLEQVFSYYRLRSEYGTFPGMITANAGAFTPPNWLVCDGTAISRATYPDLFVAIGTSWGSGDGSTTFNVPDLRGAFLRGAVTLSTITGSGSAASNNATFTAHGFNRTGVKCRLSSGTLSGLSTATDYYAIYIDANTLAFATTLANALAGTKIVLSGANSAVIAQYLDADNSSRVALASGGTTGAGVGSFQPDAMEKILGDSGVAAGNKRGNQSATAYGANSGAFTTYTAGTGHNAAVSEGTSYGLLFDSSLAARTSTETRPSNAYVNFLIKT